MTDERKLLQSMTMTRLYEMLSGHREFVKVGISYIVRIENIMWQS